MSILHPICAHHVEARVHVASYKHIPMWNNTIKIHFKCSFIHLWRVNSDNKKVFLFLFALYKEFCRLCPKGTRDATAVCLQLTGCKASIKGLICFYLVTALNSYISPKIFWCRKWKTQMAGIQLSVLCHELYLSNTLIKHQNTKNWLLTVCTHQKKQTTKMRKCSVPEL